MSGCAEERPLTAGEEPPIATSAEALTSLPGGGTSPAPQCIACDLVFDKLAKGEPVVQRCIDPCTGCGDGICSGSESPATCPADCGLPPVCGNGLCEAGESQFSCPADCGSPSVCGNGVCESGEPTSCPQDCQTGCLNKFPCP